MSNYKFLNNALRTGNFKAKKTSRFAQDCNLLERDDDKSSPDRIVVKGHSDAVDSCLYAFKLSPAYGYQPPVIQPLPGTPEYNKMQEEKHFESALEQVKRSQSQKNDNQFGTWNKDKKGIPDWSKW